MGTREALIQEILKQPEPVLRDLQSYLELLVARQNAKGSPRETWPKGYFQNTAGAFAGEVLDRPTQLPFETREEW